jgi:hypothetical protein
MTRTVTWLVALVGALLAALVASCASPASQPHQSAAPASPTTTTVARGFHSEIADIYLPRGATMDPYSNSKLEMWHANMPYSSAVGEMNALLPVNQPLDGLPWCGSMNGSDNSIYWAWASSTDKITVSVAEITGITMITLGHGTPKGGQCF